ncbi:hypothetical protein L596_008530 [Steinernema carpocapsae]|uniref:Uncharacterized protein n=1 Tax=Steinernema carpocapsae TaxID=34508 RepID=A0A4U5PCX5_STECR|nr:hypothetical protein L596_008530 [Steinernema carpocapsae]
MAVWFQTGTEARNHFLRNLAVRAAGEQCAPEITAKSFLNSKILEPNRKNRTAISGFRRKARKPIDLLSKGQRTHLQSNQ